MLVRAYRITDKLGVVALKGSIALAYVTLTGIGLLLRTTRDSLVAVSSTLYRRLLRPIFGPPARVLLALLRVIGLVLLFFLNLVLRLFGRTAYSARSAAGDAMARRAARAEMEATLAEDPLRIQNRVLGGLVIVLGFVTVAVLVWATDPARSRGNVNTVELGPVNASALAGSPEPTQAVSLATPVPTATTAPTFLNVTGSLGYVVRENGQEDIWAVNVGTRSPIRLTNDPADERDPAWSPEPNARRLAYASRQDGNWEIYVYDLNQGTPTRMTYDLSFQGGPEWSPDGIWLVYESYQGNNLDLYIMPADSSRPPERLPASSDAPDFSPTWSPDGRHIAFVSWRDGNQDIYIFDLNDQTVVNLTNTPTRHEDYPAYDPSGRFIAYSAVDNGLEKVYVQQVDQLDAPPQAIAPGRQPTWSPDGVSLIYALDSLGSTELIAAPVGPSGVPALIVPVPIGASDPSWSRLPLPQALVNSGGLQAASTRPLYIEQEARKNSDPYYGLAQLTGVDAPSAVLNERVNDSFDALRQQTNDVVGWDFLGRLEDAFWGIERSPQPGEERHNWHMAGRAFAVSRDAILSFPAPIEVVREDWGGDTYWRVFVRVAEDAQNGQLGEPLRRMPWDFLAANQGDVEAYDQGGRLRTAMPEGYFIDLTELAADYGWQRLPAGTDWRGNFNSRNYWLFVKPDAMDWYTAMRELYTVDQLARFVPATPVPAAQPTLAVQTGP